MIICFTVLKQRSFNHETDVKDFPDFLWFSLLLHATLLFKMALSLIIWGKFSFLLQIMNRCLSKSYLSFLINKPMERISIKISITCLIFSKVLLKVTTNGNLYRVAGFSFKKVLFALSKLIVWKFWLIASFEESIFQIFKMFNYFSCFIADQSYTLE